MNLSLDQANLTIGAIVIGLLGVVQCFFGYRVFRLVLVVLGLFLGAAVAVSLVNTDQTLVLVAAGLIGGLIGAVAFYFLYIIGTFLAGLILGAAVAATFAAALNLGADAANIALIAGAVIGGLLGIVLAKYIIMLSTAFTGATQIVYAVLLLLPGLGSARSISTSSLSFEGGASLGATLAILILAAIGFAVQIYSNHPVGSTNEPRPTPSSQWETGR